MRKKDPAPAKGATTLATIRFVSSGRSGRACPCQASLRIHYYDKYLYVNDAGATRRALA
jgi:hypothetical protein